MAKEGKWKREMRESSCVDAELDRSSKKGRRGRVAREGTNRFGIFRERAHTSKAWKGTSCMLVAKRVPKTMATLFSTKSNESRSS